MHETPHEPIIADLNELYFEAFGSRPFHGSMLLAELSRLTAQIDIYYIKQVREALADLNQEKSVMPGNIAKYRSVVVYEIEKSGIPKPSQHAHTDEVSFDLSLLPTDGMHAFRMGTSILQANFETEMNKKWSVDPGQPPRTIRVVSFTVARVD